MKRINAWVKASRPPSQTYIAFPILLGQLVYFRITGDFSWIGFALAQLFGLFDQLYIVYANDWADVETDATNRTYNIFSGGSRAIVEGHLSRRSVGIAATVMALLALATGVGMWILHGSALPLVLMVVGIFLLYAYSLPPFRMNYRGGGEVLQMIGVGGILPLVGFSAHSGNLAGFPWIILIATLPISLGCAIATSLPDEPSDRLSEKRTASVLLGIKRAQLVAAFLCGVSLIAWLAISIRDESVWLRLAAVLLPMVSLIAALRHVGSKPGSKALTGMVTNFVASDVLFFVTASVVVALG